MDNYFILNSNVGDKWAKVAPNMTSVKLGTCIYIVLDLVHFPSFRGDHWSMHAAIPRAFTHSVS